MTKTTSSPTVKVSRTVAAPVEQVFQAWLKTDVLKKWFAPGPMSVPEAKMEATEGGMYRIVMQSPEGKQFICKGTIQKIQENEKLIMTFGWEGSPNPEGLLTIDFKQQGDDTEVSLLHSGLVDEADAKRHEEGWVGCMDKLVQIHV